MAKWQLRLVTFEQFYICIQAVFPIWNIFWVVKLIMIWNPFGASFIFSFLHLEFQGFPFCSPSKISAVLLSSGEWDGFVPKGSLSAVTHDEICLEAQWWKSSTFFLFLGMLLVSCVILACTKKGHWRDELLILVLEGKAMFDRYFF